SRSTLTLRFSPLSLHDALPICPRRDVHRAALERRVQLGRVDVDDLRAEIVGEERVVDRIAAHLEALDVDVPAAVELRLLGRPQGDRKSTRLNSSHLGISYAVFC